MLKKIKIVLGTTSGIAATLVTGVNLAFAQLQPPQGYENLGNINFQSAIPGIIRLLLIVAFIIAFFFLLFGGIRWILSGGDKTAAESARGTLTAAIIGLIIVLLAWFIMSIIEQLFGICILSANCTQVTVPTLYQ